MNRWWTAGGVVTLAAVWCLGLASAVVRAEVTFVTIGTGEVSGVYYPTGAAIARMINERRAVYGIRAAVEATPGSVFNVDAVLAGDLEFGIVQSDRQYQAVNGLEEWAGQGPQKDLRAVFSIHPESVSLVATADSGIRSIADLKGRRVNIGSAGSGQHQNAIDALEAVGLDWRKDIQAEGAKASEAPRLLQEGRIDAFFYTVGHPNPAMQEAASGSTRVRFVAIAGPGIDRLIASQPYYAKSRVPVQAHYPSAMNTEDVETFGVKATLCTSAQVPEVVVYAITREVFENLEEFKTLHPAYAVLTREGMLEGLTAPLHPGARRYVQEAGLMP
jgi:TRAP transporter TAXI family solute receptor